VDSIKKEKNHVRTDLLWRFRSTLPSLCSTTNQAVNQNNRATSSAAYQA
jgi:hypothetical protein